ncbi:hypothetical protein [Lacimicrobium sp. SS2-24]|uniref:hypothetical protein n=1 Tax=Lacimicrobium sp. SS2-24 TaxID=2005569 RepID=UPI000B4BD6F5|nr:hypothetical protein [Lacimicrobium sp. SS2-24]
MYKLFVLSAILIVTLFSTAAKADRCDISGIWNHSSKPAKLLVDLSNAEISVYSHENNEKAIGLIVLKNLKLGSTSSSWNAQMYSAAEDSFVDVQIKSKRCNQLMVSFNGEEVLGLFR